MSDRPVRRVARFVADTQWLILPSRLDAIEDLLAMRAEGITLSEEEVRARIGAVASGSTRARGGDGVAVVPLVGVIAPRMSAMTAISGGTAVDRFMGEFRQALTDPAVKAIVIDCDSPGGAVNGVPEAAAEIYRSRGKKPLVAVANYCMASAAYYLCAACDEILCAPSGEVGSIGVVARHDDYSEQNQMNGYTPTYLYAGQYKVELTSDAPLSADARTYLQQQIDAAYADFTRFVAKARNVSVETVRRDMGQGRMLLAKDALAAKMIDGIATLDETVSRLLKGQPASGARAAHAPLSVVTATTTPTMVSTTSDSTTGFTRLTTEAPSVDEPAPTDVPPADKDETDKTVCPTCHGVGLKEERFMSDPQGQEPCPDCHGTGLKEEPCPDGTPATDDAAADLDAMAMALRLAERR